MAVPATTPTNSTSNNEFFPKRRSSTFSFGFDLWSMGSITDREAIMLDKSSSSQEKENMDTTSTTSSLTEWSLCEAGNTMNVVDATTIPAFICIPETYSVKDDEPMAFNHPLETKLEHCTPQERCFSRTIALDDDDGNDDMEQCCMDQCDRDVEDDEILSLDSIGSLASLGSLGTLGSLKPLLVSYDR